MTRKTVLKGSWRRTMASAMALVFLYSTVAAPVAEANFWAERRKFARLPQAVPSVPATVQMPPAMLAAASSLPNTISLPALQSLPAAYADIQAVHQAGPDRPWVILLQDVHDVASAQKNIAAALAHIQDASAEPLLVGLEGAAGGFDLARFRAFRNRQERDDVFGYLLDASHITGAEYFGLTAARMPRFLGVEDADLYRRNVQAYRRSAAQKAAFAAELIGLRARAAALSPVLFDDNLRVYEDLSARRHAGDADLASFLSGLHALSPDQPGFAQVRLFLDALALEKSLDMANVEAERLALLEALAARQDRKELAGLLESSLAFRMGRLSAGAYYRDLRATAADAGLDMTAFPAFDAYVRYALLAEKIDASLYPQIEAFRRAVGDALVSRPGQRRLLDVLDDVRLVEKLTSHELGAHEWESYRARQADVRRLPARLAALENAAPQGELSGLDAFEDFYAHAFARNEALVSNLHSTLITHDSSLSVLVAGGFHSPGVQDALRARGLNYAVLRPRLGQVSGRGSEYLDVYAAEPTPLDRMLLGEKVFLAPTGSLAFRDLAGLGHGERTRSLFSLLYGLLSAVRGLAFRPELQRRLGSDLDVVRRGGKWSLLLRRGSRAAAFQAQVSADALSPAGISGRAGTLNFSLAKADARRQPLFLPWRAAAMLFLALAFPAFASTARAQLVDDQVKAAKSENAKHWLKRLGHKDETVRDEAVRRLSAMATPPWPELIKRLLRSKDPLEQISVARVLENLANPNGLAALRTVAQQTEDPDVAVAAARALAKLGLPGAYALMDVGDEAALEELSLLGRTPLYQQAVHVALAPGPDRDRGARLLGYLDNPAAAVPLVDALNADSEGVAATALGSLTTLFGGHKDAVTAALKAASSRGQTTAIRAWVLLDFNGVDLSALPADPNRRFLRAAIEFSRRGDYGTDEYRQESLVLAAEAEAYVRGVMNGDKAALDALLIKPVWAERDANFANLSAAVAFMMQGRLAPFRPNPFSGLLRRIAQGAHVSTGYDNINSDFLMGGVYASKLTGMKRVIADLGHELGHNYLTAQKEYTSGGSERNAIHEAVGDIFEFAMLQSLGLLEPADVEFTLKNPIYCSICAKKEVNSAEEEHDAARMFLVKLVSVANAHGRPVDWVRVAADVQGMSIPSHMTFEQWAVRITFGILDAAAAERLSREWAAPPAKPAPAGKKVRIPSRQAIEAFFRHFARTAPAVAIFFLAATFWSAPIQARPFGGLSPEWSAALAALPGLLIGTVVALGAIEAVSWAARQLGSLAARRSAYARAAVAALAAGGAATPVKKPGALPSLPVVVLGGVLWTAKKGASAVSTLVRRLLPARGPPGPREPPRDFRVKFFFENHAEGDRTRLFIHENLPFLTDLVLELPDEAIPMFQAVSDGAREPQDALKELEPMLLEPTYRRTFEGILNALYRSGRRVWGEASDAIYAATDPWDDDQPKVDADVAFMIDPNRRKFLKAYRAAIRKSASQYALRDRALRGRISEIVEKHPDARIGVIRGAVHTALFRDVSRDLARNSRPVLREFFASPLRFWLTDELIRRAIFSKSEPTPRELLRSYVGIKLMGVANLEAMGGTYRATHIVDALTDRLSQEDFTVLTLVLSAAFHASLDDDDHTAHMTPGGRIVSHWPVTHAPGIILDWMARNGKLSAEEVRLFAPAKPRQPAAGTGMTYRRTSFEPSPSGRSWTARGAALFVFAAITFGVAAPDYFAFGLIALGLGLAALIVVDSVRRHAGRPPSGEGLRVALLQNYPLNVTGMMIAAHLRSRGVQVDVFHAWVGNLPNWKMYDAIIGSGSAYNPREHRGKSWLESEINLIREARIPILGVCFTHQLIAEAFSNGRTRKAYDYGVYTGPNKVTIDQKDPLFKGLPRTITVAEAHGDEVSEVPDEMIVTAGSEMTRVEAMRHRTRPIYSVQFHPEHSEMMGMHGLSNRHGLKILDNFIRIVRGHKERLAPRPALSTQRRWKGAMAGLTAALLALAAPAQAESWIVRGEDGKPKLNVPPIVLSTNEDGTENVVGLRSRSRALDVVISRPLNRWWEGSIYAGAHRPDRPEDRFRTDRSDNGPSVGWHVGIGIRLIPQRPSPPPREEREETEQPRQHTDIADVLRVMRDFPGSRTGIARGNGRSAVWVQREDQVVLVSGRETFYSGERDLRRAATIFFGTTRLELLDANGQPLADPVPAVPAAPAASTPETPGSDAAPGAGAALKLGAPLAFLGILLYPTPAAAADLTLRLAAADYLGVGLIALAIVAVLMTALYKTGATAALRARLASLLKKLKERGGPDDAGSQGPGQNGGRPEPLVPLRKDLLSRFDEKAQTAADKLSQNAGLLSAWSVLDDLSRHPRASGDPVPASAVAVLLNDLNNSSLKLLDAGAIARHERTLLALQTFAAQFAVEAESAPDLAKKRYGQNAAGVALLLGALSDVSPELAEALRPALFSDVLSLGKKLSAEEPNAAQAEALQTLQRIGAESAAVADADDIQGRVLQISDVLGDSLSDPDYIAALARQLPKEGDETRAALVVTDNESALRAALRNAGVEPGQNVAIRSVDSLPASAVRRDARGRLESIDVAALPGAADALAKIRIFTRTPALWWLGHIDPSRREALVEFLLWVTRDAAFRLTPARLEEALQAQKTLEIQA